MVTFMGEGKDWGLETDAFSWVPLSICSKFDERKNTEVWKWMLSAGVRYLSAVNLMRGKILRFENGCFQLGFIIRSKFDERKRLRFGNWCFSRGYIHTVDILVHILYMYDGVTENITIFAESYGAHKNADMY